MLRLFNHLRGEDQMKLDLAWSGCLHPKPLGCICSAEFLEN